MSIENVRIKEKDLNGKNLKSFKIFMAYFFNLGPFRFGLETEFLRQMYSNIKWILRRINYLTLTQGASPPNPLRYLNLPNPNLLFIIGHDVCDHLKIGYILILKKLS